MKSGATPARDRTENLLLRRQAPYPLGHGGCPVFTGRVHEVKCPPTELSSTKTIVVPIRSLRWLRAPARPRRRSPAAALQPANETAPHTLSTVYLYHAEAEFAQPSAFVLWAREPLTSAKSFRKAADDNWIFFAPGCRTFAVII
jgi:hypothetical protein